MIGIDTNILLRIVLDDDPEQVKMAQSLMANLNENNLGYVSIITVVELAWTLRRNFGFNRQAIAATLGTILNAREIVIEDEALVSAAVDRMLEGKAELADSLIAARNQAQGCTRTFTFDRRAAGTVPGMELIA